MLYKKGILGLVLAMAICVLLPAPALAADDGSATATKQQTEIDKKAAKEQKKLEKAAKERAEIDKLSSQALERLYDKVPAAREAISDAYAYATLSNTGMKLGLLGDAHGRGVAINNRTGERIYMRMRENNVGLGLGITEYDLVFVIANKDAWTSFVKNNWKMGGAMEASASDGVAGGALEGATIVRDGVWVYQVTKKGLSLEATFKGTNIYPDKNLNKKPLPPPND